MNTPDLEMFEENFRKSELGKLKTTYINTQYSLWNSLITFNAIILSVISVLRIIDLNISKNFISWLLITCSLSIFLIIINYLISKYIYFSLTNNPKDNHANDSQRTKENAKKRTYKFKIHHLQFSFEVLVIVMMVINLFKIGFLVI